MATQCSERCRSLQIVVVVVVCTLHVFKASDYIHAQLSPIVMCVKVSFPTILPIGWAHCFALCWLSSNPFFSCMNGAATIYPPSRYNSGRDGAYSTADDKHTHTRRDMGMIVKGGSSGLRTILRVHDRLVLPSSTLFILGT